MKTILMYCFVFACLTSQAQISNPKPSNINIRLSFLVFPPFSPLLTFEVKTIENLTLQLESNFVNTHGVNLKYYVSERMNGHYWFVGTAFLKSDYLRKDKNITFLPYAGYGFAHRFGKSNRWTFDSRLGIGGTVNADKNLILPVLKTGIGRTF